MCQIFFSTCHAYYFFHLLCPIYFCSTLHKYFLHHHAKYFPPNVPIIFFHLQCQIFFPPKLPYIFSTYHVKYFVPHTHQIFFPPTVPKSESRATQQCKLALPPTWASTFWWFHKWFFEEIYCIIEEGQVLVRNSVLGQIDQNWEFWKQTQTETTSMTQKILLGNHFLPSDFFGGP